MEMAKMWSIESISNPHSIELVGFWIQRQPVVWDAQEVLVSLLVDTTVDSADALYVIIAVANEYRYRISTSLVGVVYALAVWM